MPLRCNLEHIPKRGSVKRIISGDMSKRLQRSFLRVFGVSMAMVQIVNSLNIKEIGVEVGESGKVLEPDARMR
jgi:hypothetical protein